MCTGLRTKKWFFRQKNMLWVNLGCWREIDGFKIELPLAKNVCGNVICRCLYCVSCTNHCTKIHFSMIKLGFGALNWFIFGFISGIFFGFTKNVQHSFICWCQVTISNVNMTLKTTLTPPENFLLSKFKTVCTTFMACRAGYISTRSTFSMAQTNKVQINAL